MFLLTGIHLGQTAEEHTYKHTENQELKLFVVKPPGWISEDRRPAVVWFHGGGWHSGKPSPWDDRAKYLASRGLVIIDVEYRLVPRQGLDLPLPPVQDAQSAIRWVRKNAGKLGIDQDKIAASGASAGAHLAAFAGMIGGFDDPMDDISISARPNALILYKPVISTAPDGYDHKRFADRYAEFSPAHNVSADAPPTLIIGGTADPVARVPVVEKFRDAMQAAGVRCEVVFFEGDKHDYKFSKKGDLRHFETLHATDTFLMSLGWLSGEPTVTASGTEVDTKCGIR
jgi:acetyl esterase